MAGLHKLSAIGVQKIAEPGKWPDGGGLYVKVTAGLTKSWIFRFSWHGRRPEIGLGSYPQVSLAQARALAAECRDALARGEDPRERPHAPVDAPPAPTPPSQGTTFDEAARRYVDAHEASWRNPKHRQQWRNTLTSYVNPVIGAKDVAAITTHDVLSILEPVWLEKPETASRLRGRIERVLDWAKSRGLREGENVARWRGHLEFQLPRHSKVRRVKHHAALPWREIPAFYAGLMARDAPAAQALRLLILTATRTSEVLKAEWSEFDLDEAVWVVPAERTKMGRPHRAPLSPEALAIIGELAEVRQNGLLIPGQKRGRPLSDMSLLMLLRRMDRGDLTAHGFRSSFRDWCAEATGYPRELAELALAHRVGDATERAYFRSDMLDQRRQLMSNWAQHCTPAVDAKAVAAE